MAQTLTNLRRKTSDVMREADNGKEVVLTEHGVPRYQLRRIPQVDWQAAAEALRKIGPVNFLPRK